MSRLTILARGACALVAGLALSFTAPALAQTQRISITTGGTGGVYYPLGGAMANVLSKYMPGLQATAEVTGGKAVIDLSKGDGFINKITGGLKLDTRSPTIARARRRTGTWRRGGARSPAR